jgi:hypothetical protein
VTHINKIKCQSGVWLMAMMSLLFVCALHAQPADTAYAALRNLAGEVYGTDDLLVNGRGYSPQHYNAAGHPYFNAEDFTTGSLTTQDKFFDAVPLIYNIATDELVLRWVPEDGNTIFVVLNPHLVQSFDIENRHFITMPSLPAAVPAGYVEEIYKGSFLFVIKYTKSFVNNYSPATPHGSFTRRQATPYIIAHQKATKILSRKDLLRYYDENKKEIKAYLRQHHIKYKKATSAQLIPLMNFIGQLTQK